MDIVCGRNSYVASTCPAGGLENLVPAIVEEACSYTLNSPELNPIKAKLEAGHGYLQPKRTSVESWVVDR